MNNFPLIPPCKKCLNLNFHLLTKNDILFPDSAKILMGASSDLELYHGGTHTFIKNSTGDLRIRSDSLLLRNQADNETYLDANNGGSVDLYYNDSKKFETDTERR